MWKKSKFCNFPKLRTGCKSWEQTGNNDNNNDNNNNNTFLNDMAFPKSISELALDPPLS